MSIAELSQLTDEDLITHVCSQAETTDAEVELADRLGRALEEIALLTAERGGS